MAQFLEKCTEWPQMTLTCSRSKIPRCLVHPPPRPKFSSVSLYDEQFFGYGPIFGKVHRMTPNDLDMFKVKNTNMQLTYTPRPKFSSVSIYDEPFWVTDQFPGKCTEWPQMTLTCSRSKIPTCMLTYTSEAQIFVRFAPCWAIFELGHSPIFGKVYWMTPNDLNMFKVKNTNMLGTSTPEAQIFVRFTLWWAVFWLRANFWKSAPNDPKWPWHVQGQKYQHAWCIHAWGPNFCSFHSTISSFWVMG